MRRPGSPSNPARMSDLVVRLAERRFGLNGELSFNTAAAVLRAAQTALRDEKGTVEIDLTAIRRVDSAGVALLIELLRFAKQRGIALYFTHIPQQLESLAAVSGVDGLLPRLS
jgi:phospholipid transport system transporter-binding protein